MSTKYKASDPEGIYFVTLTIVGWIDVFTRVEQKNVLIDSLRYCQKEKGLELYAYCIMPNHIHMICKGIAEFSVAEIMRDFKKFTSKQIIKTILEEPESRRDWMLKYFENACEHLKREQKYKVWQNGYHAEILYSPNFLLQKLNYVHNNPVKAGIVDKPEHYISSSARVYAGMDDGEEELEIVIII